jgi:MFS family permease
MFGTLVTLGALFLSVAILLVGNGLQSTLIAVRANLEGFSPQEIGLMTSGYFAGFVAGCFLVPHIVRRVGHIRTFAALAAVAASAALTHALVLDSVVWWGLRATTGLCLAGLYMVIESWVNSAATNESRGMVFSTYRIVDLTATTAGQFLLTLADPLGFTLFSFVCILICLALVPVAMTTAVAPEPIHQTRIRLGRLYRLSPLGIVGCGLVGFATGAFWGLSPIFVQNIGLGIDKVALFISLYLVGGMVLQFPIGRLSDRFDRRTVMVAVCGLASLAGLGVAAAGALAPALVLWSAVLFGGFSIPLYSLAVAHANDYATKDDFVEMSSGLLLANGLGAVVGPLIASTAMEAVGSWALFCFTAAMHGLLGLFGIYRMTRRAPPPMAEQGSFVAMPDGSPIVSPVIMELDPRGAATAADAEPGPADRRGTDEVATPEIGAAAADGPREEPGGAGGWPAPDPTDRTG